MKNKIQNPKADIIIGHIPCRSIIVGVISVIILISLFCMICNNMQYSATLKINRYRMQSNQILFYTDKVLKNTNNDVVLHIYFTNNSELHLKSKILNICNNREETTYIIMRPNDLNITMNENKISSIECQIGYQDNTMLDVIISSILFDY